MKIEPNMYVRTKDGKIFDCYVSEQMGKPIYYPKRSKTNGYIDWNEVYKKSENIIDIVQVGDYVNGMKVTRIGGTRWDKNDLHCYCEHNGDENWKQVMIPAKDIKSIVTKEAFKSMEYMLGDK